MRLLAERVIRDYISEQKEELTTIKEAYERESEISVDGHKVRIIQFRYFDGSIIFRTERDFIDYWNGDTPA